MKKMRMLLQTGCMALLLTTGSFAQMYTVTDLGRLVDGSHAGGMNASGQVAGDFFLSGNTAYHAFRTAPNSLIDAAANDLGTLGGTFSSALGINASGQVVGYSYTTGDSAYHAFRTAPNSAINPATDDLGTLGGSISSASAINNSGQVVGYSYATGDSVYHAFRTAPNSAINPATDDLGTLGGALSSAGWPQSINGSGQVAGSSQIAGGDNFTYHAFRTAPNQPINPGTDDLGTLGGESSNATAINDSGQVVGYSQIAGDDIAYHAFRTAPNQPIHPATDDLGTLGGIRSVAYGIDSFGQVVGTSYASYEDETFQAFLYAGGVMYDLNRLVGEDFCCPGCDCHFDRALAINDGGQILIQGFVLDWVGWAPHAFLLTPVYKASVQPPISAGGSSVFKNTKGMLPVKFTLIQYGTPTCTFPPATISLTRTAGERVGPVAESAYSTNANDGTNFRADADACQYIYNLPLSGLGAGAYRVDISIERIFVGHGVFALNQ